MIYEDIFNKFNIANNIPLEINGHKLNKEMKAKVVLLTISYDSMLSRFYKEMELAGKKLKKEGYDNRARDIQKMEEIDSRLETLKTWKKGCKDDNGNEIPKPLEPTEEELTEASKIRETKTAFDEEQKELDEAYQKAYEEKLKEEVKMTEHKLSSTDFAEIIDLIGTDGTITIKIGDAKRENACIDFIKMIAANLVEL